MRERERERTICERKKYTETKRLKCTQISRQEIKPT